ncbi:MAG: adenylate/guanylate cyclase domain-containing protein [Verrucomicrobiota bacterium]
MANPQATRDRKTARLGMLGGILLVSLIGLLLQLKFGSGLARLSYDLPFTWTQFVPEDLVMVYVDSKIKSKLGQSTDQPLDRRFYTQLLERLTRDGARLVLFDILFDSPQADSNTDATFAEAIRKHGKVVLVGDYIQQWRGDIATYGPLPPIGVLTDAAAGWGLANVSIDPDLEVRVLGTGNEDFPSAGWVAASLIGAETTRLPESRLTERWLNYYCEPTALSAVNLDHALETNGLPRGFFRGKLVVVGSRGEGGVSGAGRDEFRTPYSLRNKPAAPGATIHAFTLLNLAHKDWMTRLTFLQESALVLIWGILISMALLRLRPWAAMLVAPVAFGGFALAAVSMQARYQVWFSWLTPAAVQTSIALGWSVGFRYLVESRRRRQLRRAFAAYLSPHMADRIADSDVDVALGGKEVHATIMFTDLEGFTSMTEKMPPSEVSEILISYFNETTRAILEKDGTIIKYMGDAVMATWGAPMASPRAAQTAVEAALGMHRAGGKVIAGRRFRTRIGINSGLVLAGNLGSEFRFDYTLIGETTNVASRLEGLNKYLGTDILITESTRRELNGEIVLRSLGQFIVAGTTRPLGVYEVIGLSTEFQTPPPWLAQFAAALEHFKQRELDAAEALFQKVSEQRGAADGPSEFYLKQIARCRAHPESGEPWDGVIRFESK